MKCLTLKMINGGCASCGRMPERKTWRSSIATEAATMATNRMRPIHPGGFWMNLQSAYDLRKAEQESAVQIGREVGPLKEAA